MRFLRRKGLPLPPRVVYAEPSMDLPEARKLVAKLAAGDARGISVDLLSRALAMVLCSIDREAS